MNAQIQLEGVVFRYLPNAHGDHDLEYVFDYLTIFEKLGELKL